MILVACMTVMALVLGAVLPLHRGVPGFLAAAACVFLVQFGVNTARGFEGTSIEESLLLFNNSWGAYVGFNLQITYRAFALPVLGLAAAVISRLHRANA